MVLPNLVSTKSIRGALLRITKQQAILYTSAKWGYNRDWQLHINLYHISFDIMVHARQAQQAHMRIYPAAQQRQYATLVDPVQALASD